MYFVGIDIAKKTHQATIICSDGKLIVLVNLSSFPILLTVLIYFWKSSLLSTLIFRNSKSVWKRPAITG